MSDPQHILIRLPNWLGDALLARPLLHALTARFPQARLRAVGPGSLLGLLAQDGAAECGDPWPRQAVERTRLVAALRAWHPDVALVLPPSFSSAWFAYRTGAARRVGYRHEGRAFLLTDAPRRPPRGERHLADEYLDLGGLLGATGTRWAPLPVAAEAADRAAGLLQAVGGSLGPVAVLAPGAIYGPAKRWPADRFVALGRELVARGMTVLACGGPSEAEVCGQVAQAIGPSAHALAGRTDVPVQAALCARAALCVANDSGLAHLAAAVGCPTVVIFGSTSAAWTAPRGARVRVACRPPVCSPCFQRTCRIGYRCLTAVPTRLVLELALEVMAA